MGRKDDNARNCLFWEEIIVKLKTFGYLFIISIK